MRKYGVATVDMHAPIIEQVAAHAARHAPPTCSLGPARHAHTRYTRPYTRACAMPSAHGPLHTRVLIVIA